MASKNISIPRKLLAPILARPILKLCSRFPIDPFIALLRQVYVIQMDIAQLSYISQVLKKQAPCHLLVFGLGNDSIYWHTLNLGGTTVFLEDNESWYTRVRGHFPELTACRVKYDTRRSQWRDLLKRPNDLEMDLPRAVLHQDWDLIIVDGPAGHKGQDPGRMKSIYAASKLMRPRVSIFVHDCNRVVEDAYCAEYLKKENLVREISGRGTTLRHYRPEINNPVSRRKD